MAGKDGIPFNNGAVLNISQIIWAIMSSAAEAELSALFINAKTAVLMQQTLTKLGHPQPQHGHQCKQTRQQHTHYSPSKNYQKHSRPWTCISTGYGVAMPKKANSAITGDQAHKTQHITSPSITPPHTTRLCIPLSSQLSTILNTGKFFLTPTNNDPCNTDQNNSHHKILCQTSLTDTKVPRHATEHDNSKRCLRFHWQGCVRPTSRYLPIGGPGLQNKQLPPRVQNSLRNTQSQDH